MREYGRSRTGEQYEAVRDVGRLKHHALLSVPHDSVQCVEHVEPCKASECNNDKEGDRVEPYVEDLWLDKACDSLAVRVAVSV